MEEKKRSGGFFNKTLTLRIVSLLCALLLWFYVSEVESPTSERSIDSVAVTLRNKDIMTSETGLSVLSSSLYETNIVLSGKKSVLNKIDYEDISATVDLSKLTEPGTHELTISVTPPAGTTVSSINPRFITVTIDKTVAKPFDIETDIYYSSTYEIGECVISDTQQKVITSTSVSGPETAIERISKVVAKVDFGAINSSVEAKTNLICLDSNGEEIKDPAIRLTPESVVIKQPVYTTKTLPLKASQAGGTFTDEQITFKISPSKIEVKGDPKILSELTEINLTPINEQEVIGESLKNTVTSQIKLPEGLILSGTQNTATITVSVKNVKKRTFDITLEDITVINAPDFMNITYDDFIWSVPVINTSDTPIEKSDLKFTVDLKDYINTGMYTVMVTPEFKDEITWAYFPYTYGYFINFSMEKK